MRRIIIGISGASGALLGVEMLKAIKRLPSVESHLIISDNSVLTLEQETHMKADDVKALADRVYDLYDMAADISSGSFKTDGMIIIPCSMKTLAGVANGFSDNLLLRAADVVLKEGRKLVVVPREAPFSRIHLRNMMTLSECGAVIIPPVMTFYSGQETAEEMAAYLTGKILDQFGIDYDGYKRWGTTSDGAQDR